MSYDADDALRDALRTEDPTVVMEMLDRLGFQIVHKMSETYCPGGKHVPITHGPAPKGIGVVDENGDFGIAYEDQPITSKTCMSCGYDFLKEK